MSPSQFGALQRQSSVRGGVGQGRYLLRFESLFHAGRGLCFPCDERGQVTLDQLSEQARENYLFARAVVAWVRAAAVWCPEPAHAIR